MPYFSMSKDELLSDGSAACTKELKRRGRCGKTGVKLSRLGKSKAPVKRKARKATAKKRKTPSSREAELHEDWTGLHQIGGSGPRDDNYQHAAQRRLNEHMAALEKKQRSKSGKRMGDKDADKAVQQWITEFNKSLR